MLKLNGQKVWITSDWHQNHLNLCTGTSNWEGKRGCRDFANPDEMWEVIRNNINKLVASNDIILNLGDVIFGDKTQLPKLMSEINCKNHLVVAGNHDDWIKLPKNRHYQELFNLGFYDFKELTINGRLFILSHYAMRTWREQHRKSIQCYAHSHGSLPDDPKLLSLDVGCDTCLFGHEKYHPYSSIEIVDIMTKYKQHCFQDHHSASTN